MLESARLVIWKLEKMLDLNKKKKHENENLVTDSPLGKSASYINQYKPDLLFPIPRKVKRQEIHVPDILPFKGFDTWNAYEVSWLNQKGKPVVVLVRFDFSCESKNIIESKSFKLYLNSFNNTKFDSVDEVKQILTADLTKAVVGDVFIHIYLPDDLLGQQIEKFDGIYLDEYDITCEKYTTEPEFLVCNRNEVVEETVRSDLLKSNCLVTGQPDWGSVQITYKGPKIDKEGLLKYIVSFRDHNEFHEQCVERIFMDISQRCHPQSLTVEARYTRRGGLDINPIRSSEPISPTKNIRMARQ